MRFKAAATGFLATFLLLFLALGAQAQGVDPFGGSELAEELAVVEFTASAEFVADFVAVFAAERDHVSISPAERACARVGVVSSDGDGNLNYECVAYWHCGGERVDDLYTGKLSASDASGVYAEYLTVVSNLAAAGGPVAPDSDIDLDLLNTDILAGNLGEPNELFLLPVFYYCRSGASGPLEIYDPTYSVSFGWDTDVEAEYDLDTVSNRLIDELFERLEARAPDIQMTPPLEKRVAIVNFPSWFWIDGNLPPIEVSGLSDRGTFFLRGRATLDYVEWSFGDDEPLNCAWDDMLAWDPDKYHPVNNRPHCSQVFEKLGPWELSATAHYNVEQQLSQRYGGNGAFIQGPWEPHPTRPTFAVTNNAGTIETRPIYSLNVPIDAAPIDATG